MGDARCSNRPGSSLDDPAACDNEPSNEPSGGPGGTEAGGELNGLRKPAAVRLGTGTWRASEDDGSVGMAAT